MTNHNPAVSAIITTKIAIIICNESNVENVFVNLSVFPVPSSYVKKREVPLLNAPFINESIATIPPTAWYVP